MRKIVIVKDIAQIQAAHYFEGMFALDDGRKMPEIRSITHMRDRPNLIAQFAKKEIDVLIVPLQFATGWSLNATDYTIEYQGISKEERATIHIRVED